MDKMIVVNKGRMCRIFFAVVMVVNIVFSYVLPSINVFAEDVDTIVREYVFETDSLDFSYEENMEIEVDGEIHEANGISYEIISDGLITREIEYLNITNKELDETLTVFNEDGNEVVLSLKDVQWDSVVITRQFREEVDEAPDFPEKITTEDGLVIPLEDVTIEKTDYIEPFIIEGIFYGNKETDYYVLKNGERWLKNEATPNCQGYENLLNTYLGLDENYLIQSGEWSSDYITKDGEDVRYANFYGLRKKNIFTAYYREEFFTGKALYSNEGENIYTVTAIVEYENQSSTILDNIVPLVSSPIFQVVSTIGLFILLLIALLVSISEKRKKEIYGG